MKDKDSQLISEAYMKPHDNYALDRALQVLGIDPHMVGFSQHQKQALLCIAVLVEHKEVKTVANAEQFIGYGLIDSAILRDTFGLK